MTTDNDKKEENVKIYAPDHALSAKIGTTVLDQVIPPKAVQAAQDTIKKSTESFFRNVYYI